jgi:DNA invertase Pin-like site-specific DNA recombinase
MAQATPVKEMRAASVRPVEIARRLGIGRSSVYRTLEA